MRALGFKDSGKFSAFITEASRIEAWHKFQATIRTRELAAQRTGGIGTSIRPPWVKGPDGECQDHYEIHSATEKAAYWVNEDVFDYLQAFLIGCLEKGGIWYGWRFENEETALRMCGVAFDVLRYIDRLHTDGSGFWNHPATPSALSTQSKLEKGILKCYTATLAPTPLSPMRQTRGQSAALLAASPHRSPKPANATNTKMENAGSQDHPLGFRMDNNGQIWGYSDEFPGTIERVDLVRHPRDNKLKPVPKKGAKVVKEEVLVRTWQIMLYSVLFGILVYGFLVYFWSWVWYCASLVVRNVICFVLALGEKVNMVMKSVWTWSEDGLQLVVNACHSSVDWILLMLSR